MEQDPAAAIFGEEPDLYGALDLAPECTAAEIKKAYRLLALRHHPDKLPPTATESEREEASAAFQRIGYAYAVLSDETRRARFDKTGRTDESIFGEGKDAAEWSDYFKELWEGEVNASTLDEFYAKYVGSEEERQDLYDAYTEGKGSIEFILEHVNAPDASKAEDRFTEMINAGIKDGAIKSTSAWTKNLKDSKARAKRRQKVDAEATEAEAAAKELGVHDKLFGNGKKAKNGGDADEDSLKALIQARQANRMETLIGSLEAKYGAADHEPAPKKRKGKKAAEPTDEGPYPDRAAVTNAEFGAMQREVEARRSSKSSGSKRKKA